MTSPQGAFVPFASSTFDTDDDGWSIVDFPNSMSHVSPGSILPLDWNAAGGESGAYVLKRDPSEGIYAFNAPVKYLGNLTSVAGGTLEFSLRSDRQDWTADSVVSFVGEIGGATRAVVALIQPQPTVAWTRYSIPLVAESFLYDNRSGATLSEIDFRSVLANVAAIRINAEYGGIVVETTALDSVRLLQPSSGEPASLSVGLFPVVTVIGSVGFPYRIEFSNDVNGASWIALTNLVLPVSPYLFVDKTWTDSKTRFYRAVELQ